MTLKLVTLLLFTSLGGHNIQYTMLYFTSAVISNPTNFLMLDQHQIWWNKTWIQRCRACWDKYLQWALHSWLHREQYFQCQVTSDTDWRDEYSKIFTPTNAQRGHNVEILLPVAGSSKFTFYLWFFIMAPDEVINHSCRISHSIEKNISNFAYTCGFI